MDMKRKAGRHSRGQLQKHPYIHTCIYAVDGLGLPSEAYILYETWVFNVLSVPSEAYIYVSLSLCVSVSLSSTWNYNKSVEGGIDSFIVLQKKLHQLVHTHDNPHQTHRPGFYFLLLWSFSDLLTEHQLVHAYYWMGWIWLHFQKKNQMGSA